MPDVAMDAAAIRARFIEERGAWPPAFDRLLELDPAFVEAYLRFSMAPWRSGALDAKTKELVYVAINLATTHRYESGARAHIAAALRHGATVAELVDVAELTVVLGVHTMTLGAPILAAEMAALGMDVPEVGPLGEELRSRYLDDRGSFPPPLETVLAMHPEYVDAYRELSSIPVARGNLDRKTVELIVIALDSSTTHLHEPGLRAHIRTALMVGAAPAEILEVLELTSVLGVHGTTLGIELIAEACARLPDPGTPDAAAS
jgi:alkylhydroperoxidase/carboxymuconolactone decarboxylase family protein YurZ